MGVLLDVFLFFIYWIIGMLSSILLAFILGMAASALIALLKIAILPKRNIWLFITCVIATAVGLFIGQLGLHLCGWIGDRTENSMQWAVLFGLIAPGSLISLQAFFCLVNIALQYTSGIDPDTGLPDQS